MPRQKTSLMRKLRGIFTPFIMVACIVSFVSAQCAAQIQNQPHQLGTAMTDGEVYINDARISLGKEILAGDLIRTGPTGTATFTPTASNSGGFIRLASNSSVLFAGDSQDLAEIKSGSLQVNSQRAGSGLTVRAGNFVVAAVAEGEESASKIEALPDGGFMVTCLAGSVGVIPFQKAQGMLMQQGQSVNISADGQLSMIPAAARSVSSGRTEPAAISRSHKRRWILIGLATAGAAIAAGTLVASGAGASSASATPAAVTTTPAPTPTPSPAPPAASSGASSASAPSSSSGATSAGSGSSSSGTSATSSTGSPSSTSGTGSTSSTTSTTTSTSPQPPAQNCQDPHHKQKTCPTPQVGFSLAFHF